MVITSDHGYAASGPFPDSDKKQTDYIKKTFKSGHWIDGNGDTGTLGATHRSLPEYAARAASIRTGTPEMEERRRISNADAWRSFSAGGGRTMD